MCSLGHAFWLSDGTGSPRSLGGGRSNVLRSPGHRSLHIAPEPAKGVGEIRGHAFAAVEALGPVDAEVVVHVFERGGHHLVGEGPVAEFVVEIVFTIEQIDADGFAP